MSYYSKRVSTRIPERAEKASNCFDRLVSVFREAEARRELRRRLTFGVYVLKTSESFYGLPFVGINDDMALAANKEILPIANLYKIGEYCRIDGKIKLLNKPQIVLDK